MKIKMLKNTRQLDIPEYASIDELKAILCKWAPYVAMDENKSPYTFLKKSAFSSFSDIKNAFSSIFGNK